MFFKKMHALLKNVHYAKLTVEASDGDSMSEAGLDLGLLVVPNNNLKLTSSNQNTHSFFVDSNEMKNNNNRSSNENNDGYQHFSS